MGQTLLPDHFIAQEEALLEDAAAHFRLHGLPAYGIAALRWNQTLLAEGVLSISAATLVTPAGVLIDVPGQTLFDRKGEHSVELLEKRRQRYLMLAEQLRDVIVVDGTRTPEQVRRTVTAAIWRRYAAAQR